LQVIKIRVEETAVAIGTELEPVIAAVWPEVILKLPQNIADVNQWSRFKGISWVGAHRASLRGRSIKIGQL
jgi:hypothetical protein